MFAGRVTMSSCQCQVSGAFLSGESPLFLPCRNPFSKRMESIPQTKPPPSFKWKTFEPPAFSTITVDTTVPQTPVTVRCRMDRVAPAKTDLRVWNRVPLVERSTLTNRTQTLACQTVTDAIPRFVQTVLMEHGTHVPTFKPNFVSLRSSWNASSRKTSGKRRNTI